MDDLKFAELRAANIERLPLFRDKHGRICHEPDGSDWSNAQWMNAITGELGEMANLISAEQEREIVAQIGRFFGMLGDDKYGRL